MLSKKSKRVDEKSVNDTFKVEGASEPQLALGIDVGNAGGHDNEGRDIEYAVDNDKLKTDEQHLFEKGEISIAIIVTTTPHEGAAAKTVTLTVTANSVLEADDMAITDRKG